MVLLRALALAAVLAAALPGARLAAQTNDALFGAWRWAPEPLGSRPGGLGGAYVAVADSVKAARVNPAGLALVPDWEVGFSSLRLWTGAAKGGRYVRLAAYLAETDTPSSGGLAGVVGGPTARVREAGFSAAVSPWRGVRLGVTAARTRLRLSGGSAPAAGMPAPAAGVPMAGVALAGESSELRWTAGLLLDLIGRPGITVPSLRLGVALQPGFDWTVQRSATGPHTGVERSDVDLRRPTVASAGLAWRTSGRWTVTGQADLIRYGEVVDTLSRNVGAPASDLFRLSEAVEPSLGVEFASHLWCGCGNVRARAGIRGRSPGSLRYVGSDPVLARAFPGGDWDTVLTLGGSYVGEYLGRAIRLDLDSTDLLDGPRLSFGVAVRF
jgi:hypothetical protein